MIIHSNFKENRSRERTWSTQNSSDKGMICFPCLGWPRQEIMTFGYSEDDRGYTRDKTAVVKNRLLEETWSSHHWKTLKKKKKGRKHWLRGVFDPAVGKRKSQIASWRPSNLWSCNPVNLLWRNCKPWTLYPRHFLILSEVLSCCRCFGSKGLQ